MADAVPERLRAAVDAGHNRQLILLRWIAIASVAATALVSSSLALISDSVALWLVVGVMTAVNMVLTSLAWRPLFVRHAHGCVVVQLGFDVVALTLLVHFAGGIQNPFAFFFVFLVLIAGMACSRAEAWALAAAAFVLFGGTAVLEHVGWVPHYALHLTPGVPPSGGWHSAPYLFGVLVVLGSILFGVVAYATTTMAHLRETVQAERALRERLERQERLALIGEVVASVVHELSTPLNGVRNSFRALRRDPEGFLRHAGILDLMEEALERMVVMSRRLLMLSREPQIDRRPVGLNAVVEGALAQLHGQIESSAATVERRLGAVPPVLADEVALSEVVTNLLTNALDAVHGGGRVVVETSNGGADVELSVADTGPGIPAAIRAQLFEPFQSTKPLGKGTGLGLAISKRLVDAHGGTISIDSREGAGTTVVVRVPLDGGGGA